LRRFLGRFLAAAHSGRGGISVTIVDPMVDFRCNICGAPNSTTPEALTREHPSCVQCASTVRERAMIHLLTSELLGNSVALPDLTTRADLTGIGLSDAEVYAMPLTQKLSYTNTYFHAEPLLDIANVSPDKISCYDFIIASDVFEHIAPPVGRAFSNARRLLKRGGVFIFSVPFSLEADTVEHFPELHEFQVVETPAGRRLENRTADGRAQTFADLVFHGGDGATLEMRLFSRAGLEREFAAAGFARVRFADEPCLAHGIVWPEPWSVPMVAYA
jgi:SAM-dependent methyltransferase